MIQKATSSAVSYLAETQSPDGGWGYFEGQTPGVEPTSAVLLSLNGHSQGIDSKKAISWLLSIQNDDGGWGLNQYDHESGWLTAWGVLALAKNGVSGQDVNRAIQWLEAEPVLQISENDELAAGERVAGIDFSLRGWPWQPGQASWVEPTALAILALYASGLADIDRVQEAARYMTNRRCQGGGWNVGNPVMFDSLLPARTHPTALSLLALSKTRPESILEEDYKVLLNEALNDQGASALSLASITLKSVGRAADDMLGLLVSFQKENGSWEDSPYQTALCLTALSGVEL